MALLHTCAYRCIARALQPHIGFTAIDVDDTASSLHIEHNNKLVALISDFNSIDPEQFTWEYKASRDTLVFLDLCIKQSHTSKFILRFVEFDAHPKPR